MTAPVTTPRKSRSSESAGTTMRRVQRSARPGSGRAASTAMPEGRSTAAQKAYERRERRTGSLRDSGGLVTRGSDTRMLAKRIPFVALVLALLVSGMVLTLWLSTNSTGQSYAISAAKSQNQDLRNQKAALEQAVEAGNSAPVLARKAGELGMVQSSNVPRLIVDANGAVRLEGKPAPADGPAPSPLTSVRPYVAPSPTPKLPVPPVQFLPPVQVPTAPAPSPEAPAPVLPGAGAPGAGAPGIGGPGAAAPGTEIPAHLDSAPIAPAPIAPEPAAPERVEPEPVAPGPASQAEAQLPPELAPASQPADPAVPVVGR